VRLAPTNRPQRAFKEGQVGAREAGRPSSKNVTPIDKQVIMHACAGTVRHGYDEISRYQSTTDRIVLARHAAIAKLEPEARATAGGLPSAHGSALQWGKTLLAQCVQDLGPVP